MPRYVASISEMLTMPVGVLTTDYIDVWCNSATDTPHKIRVGDMIAVKWNADVHDHEYTWCTVLATTHVAANVRLPPRAHTANFACVSLYMCLRASCPSRVPRVPAT